MSTMGFISIIAALVLVVAAGPVAIEVIQRKRRQRREEAKRMAELERTMARASERALAERRPYSDEEIQLRDLRERLRARQAKKSPAKPEPTWSPARAPQRDTFVPYDYDATSISHSDAHSGFSGGGGHFGGGGASASYDSPSDGGGGGSDSGGCDSGGSDSGGSDSGGCDSGGSDSGGGCDGGGGD